MSENGAQGMRIIRNGAENSIRTVVLFSNQAFVTRLARIKVTAGQQRIGLESHAFAIDDHSAQAKVRGAGEILSVQLKTIPVQDAPQDELRDLEKKKKDLSRKRNELLRQRRAVTKKLSFLDSTVAFAETEVPKKLKTELPKPEELEKLLEFLDSGFGKLGELEGELDIRLEDIGEEINLLERRIREHRKPGEDREKIIEVVFRSDKEQEIEIEASYAAHQASWEPVYKLDVPPDLASANLTMFTKLIQGTGEDWIDARLTVSNAVPMKGSELPRVETQYVFLPIESPTRSMGGGMRRRTVGQGEEEVLRAVAMAAGGASDESLGLDESLDASLADLAQAGQRELPLAFEYDLPQEITMNSGGDDTLLPLYSKEVESRFFDFVAPSRDPHAYLVCEATPDRELLSGIMNVHLGGRFVGSVTLAEQRAGEPVTLNLGVDRGVKVNRRRSVDKVSETFFGVMDRSSVAREIEYRIDIENLKGEPAKLRLVEPVPVSKTDRIQIKGVEVKPEPTNKEYLDREGVQMWEFDLKPQETRAITVHYFVKHPKDRQPVGI